MCQDILVTSKTSNSSSLLQLSGRGEPSWVGLIIDISLCLNNLQIVV